MIGQNITKVPIIWVVTQARENFSTHTNLHRACERRVSEQSLCLSMLLCNTEHRPCQEGARNPEEVGVGEGKSPRL